MITVANVAMVLRFLLMVQRVKVKRLVYKLLLLLLLIDRDECALGKQQNGHNCPDISKCNNTIGSFECICPSGYRLNENQGVRSCEGIKLYVTKYFKF